MSATERRKARLLRLAERWDERAAEFYRRYREIADSIPPGQPVLVDHYSARRHRRDIERMDALMREVSEAEKRAAEYRRRAEAVGSRVSAYDEDAIEQLREKLEAERENHERMKRVNRLIRSAVRAGRNPMELVPELKKMGISEKDARLLTRGTEWGYGYISAAIGNARARIRRLERRIEQLEAVKVAPVTERRVGDVVYREDDGRVQIIFPDKPDADTRALLKRNGFRWSPKRQAWVRQLTQNGRWAAERVLEALTGDGDDS